VRHLILGGVKSGKTRHAQRLAAELSQQQDLSVHVVATAEAKDAEMSERIARHRQDRDPTWSVSEVPLELSAELDRLNKDDAAGVVVVDCLTLWLTNLLMLEDQERLKREVEALLKSVRGFSKPLFMVSNETNMGITPLGELSRKYCDEAGLIHQCLAQECEQVSLVVAGLPLALKTNK
jgi:adenosylcobinamide kinase / adenosylcobinamide-phosphate guanylyltransferase